MSYNTLIAAEVISAYVTNNSVPASELPDLIRAVVLAFDNLGQLQVEEPVPTIVPAVPIKKSVHHDYLVSLEDGKRYQTLRRHLSALGLTPHEYRAKWDLPADYPMVARAYSAKRSELSKAFGLGRKKTVEPVVASAMAEEVRSAQTASVAVESAPEGVQDAPEAAREAA